MQENFKRIFVIVIDSVGIGAAVDADKYHDEGADTLGSIGKYYQGNWELPNLQKLGLGNIRQENPIAGVPAVAAPLAYFGKMQENSAGKDSMDGHWEMMGLPVMTALHTFPNGFPQALLDKVAAYSGRKIIVNKPYSGTEVINDYGERQLETGELIVYTSGDSVFQIAANEAVIPLAELYDICAYTRSITIDEPYRIGRIIARPYVGTNQNNFVRTANRHDYTIEPTTETDLDRLKNAGFDVIGVGKINDIFSKHGLTENVYTENNSDGMAKLTALMSQNFHGFCFTNLVDFDAQFGHRRDPKGYGEALMTFDKELTEVLTNLRQDDLLMITADHGNDPSFVGTDHTREFVPLIAYSPRFIEGNDLGTRTTFADIGTTILENFGIAKTSIGTSFLSELH